eukprot:TRINITY_DN12688_c0_g1_i1.p1 TRINITY_DN12688_c0_g1~~TRINITY_DN12688_c0_g1_i1.p1  ORF type:complete len:186 (+),score=52.96 TRINITY_DN12688_c0_g1_i1:497-1054(+)
MASGLHRAIGLDPNELTDSENTFILTLNSYNVMKMSQKRMDAVMSIAQSISQQNDSIIIQLLFLMISAGILFTEATKQQCEKAIRLCTEYHLKTKKKPPMLMGKDGGVHFIIMEIFHATWAGDIFHAKYLLEKERDPDIFNPKYLELGKYNAIVRLSLAKEEEPDPIMMKNYRKAVRFLQDWYQK